MRQSFSELVRPHLVKPRHMSSLLTTVVLMLMSSSLPTAVSFTSATLCYVVLCHRENVVLQLLAALLKLTETPLAKQCYQAGEDTGDEAEMDLSDEHGFDVLST